MVLHLLVLDRSLPAKRVNLHDNNNLLHNLNLRDQLPSRILLSPPNFCNDLIPNACCCVDAESAAFEHTCKYDDEEECCDCYGCYADCH